MEAGGGQERRGAGRRWRRLVGRGVCACSQMYMYRRRVLMAEAEIGGIHPQSGRFQWDFCKAPFSSSAPIAPREMGISSRSSGARSPPLPPCARASPQPACTIRMRGPRLGGSWHAPPVPTCRQGGGGGKGEHELGPGWEGAGTHHRRPPAYKRRDVGVEEGAYGSGPRLGGSHFTGPQLRESVNVPTCIDWISNSSNGGRYTRSVPLGGTPASSWPSSTSGSPAVCGKARIYKNQALRSQTPRS